MVLWWFTHIRSALFHERGHLSGTMITGILEQFLHLKASLSQSLDSFVVTKHCLFSRSSPLNFLCSTGSKWLFSHLCKSLLLVNKSRLCLFPPPMFISCGKSWNVVCSPSFYCVTTVCPVRMTAGPLHRETPRQKSLALCVKMADWFLYSLNVL